MAKKTVLNRYLHKMQVKNRLKIHRFHDLCTIFQIHVFFFSFNECDISISNEAIDGKKIDTCVFRCWTYFIHWELLERFDVKVKCVWQQTSNAVYWTELSFTTDTNTLWSQCLFCTAWDYSHLHFEDT